MLRTATFIVALISLGIAPAIASLSQCESSAAILDRLLAGSETIVIGTENFSAAAAAFDRMIPGSDPMKMAYDDYLGLGYQVMNKALREDKPVFDAATLAELQKKLDLYGKSRRLDPNYTKFHRTRSLLNAHELEQLFVRGFSLQPGITLHRAIGLKADELPVAGQIWSDPAFVSTSVKPAKTMFIWEANGYSTKKLKVFLKIENRGYKGKVLPGNYTEKSAEYEIILPRNTPMKIISVKREGDQVDIEAQLIE